MGFDNTDYKKLAKRAKRQALREEQEMRARAERLDKAEMMNAKRMAEFERIQNKKVDEGKVANIKLGSNPLFKSNRLKRRKKGY